MMPHRKHIEEDVFQTSMHEHVGKQLIELEVRSHEEMQAQEVVKVDAIAHEHDLCQVHQQVDND